MISGIGADSRARLTKVLRSTRGTIAVSDAAEALSLPRPEAAKLLARWARQGWLSRVRRGLYVPVPLESATTELPLEDAWVVANRLYAPCYVCGWSAAEYWDLTEQISRSLWISTTQRPRDRRPVLQGTSFELRTVSESYMFGLKAVWRGQTKVMVSNPARTVLDLMDDPSLAGGIRMSADILESYLAREGSDLDELLGYAEQLGNGAVFKRIGFLLERLGIASPVIERCRDSMTLGNTRLDSSLPSDRLVTRWRLWIPASWLEHEQP